MIAALLTKHWRLIGLGLILALLAIQTVRINNAKSDLAQAKAALINPATRKPWRDEAIRDARDLATCRENVGALDRSLTAQNEAVAAQAAESAQRVAEAEKGLQQALKGRAKAEAQARDLLRPPVGIDACARTEEIDRRFLETLR